MHPIPDVSQFQVIAGRNDVTKDERWPAGRIEAIPHTFPVAWRIEKPQDPTGWLEVTQEKMSPMVIATEAWDQLHTLVPRLYEEANLDFRGKLCPGLTISAEIIRKDVRVAVEFEAIRKGKIKFILEVIPNMVTWAEIHAHFSSFDERIPPLDCYIDEENRPYHPETLLEFKPAKGIEIPDTTRGFGGAAGGVSRGGYLLPPIIFPKAIHTSKGKIGRGSPDPVVNPPDTDSSSDSPEDEEGDDTHKLHKLAQAAAKQQTITVEIRGEYAWGGGMHEAIFAKEFSGMSKPSHMIEHFKQRTDKSNRLGWHFREDYLSHAFGQRWDYQENKLKYLSSRKEQVFTPDMDSKHHQR
jgi:hypothetical protein